MRITILSHSYPSPVGGIPSYASGLAKALANNGHEVTVIAPPDEHSPPSMSMGTLTIIRPEWMSEPGARSSSIVRFLQTFRHVMDQRRQAPRDNHIRSADQVLLSSLWWHPAIGLSKAGIPYSIIMHGGETLDLSRQRGGLVARWRMSRYRESIQNAKTVFANSNYTASLIHRFSGRQKGIEVVRCGVDASLLDCDGDAASARRALDLNNRPVVLSVGRLVRRKGFDKALEAIALLRREFPDILYVIVGEGPDEPRLRTIAGRLKLDNCVLFTGKIDSNILSNWYSACDVFVMPSRMEGGQVEGFGIVFLEANAYGKPVVAGRSGGVPDAVINGVTGFLSDPEDCSKIAQAISRLLNDETLRETMGKAGRQRIRTELNWETIAKRYIQIWRETS